LREARSCLAASFACRSGSVAALAGLFAVAKRGTCFNGARRLGLGAVNISNVSP